MARAAAKRRTELGATEASAMRGEAEIVANCSKDDVCGTALASLEMAAAKVSVTLHVTDQGHTPKEQRTWI